MLIKCITFTVEWEDIHTLEESEASEDMADKVNCVASNIKINSNVPAIALFLKVIAIAQAQPVYEIHHIIHEKAEPKAAPAPAAVPVPAPAGWIR